MNSSDLQQLSLNGIKVSWVKDFIVCFEKLLPPDLCQRIIAQYTTDPRKRQGLAYTPGDKLTVNSDKVSIDLEISPDGAWKELHDEIHARVTAALTGYISLSPGLQVCPLQWTGYNIKRYVKGEGQFKWHFDSLHQSTLSRQLAFVIYLNHVSEGGETEFHHQQIKAQPSEGGAVIFPTFWTHMHRGCIPISNDKYIITSFVKFALDAAF
jgi:hypothetical protein